MKRIKMVIGLKGDPANVVSEATREHERRVAEEMTWPALTPELRCAISWRAQVYHEVRCGRG